MSATIEQTHSEMAIHQDEFEDGVEQTQCGKLIGGAPGDDVTIVVGHVVVIVIALGGDIHRICGLLDDGHGQGWADDVRLEPAAEAEV